MSTSSRCVIAQAAPRATLPRVDEKTSPKSLGADRAARVRKELRALVESFGRGGQTKAAKLLGVSQQHLSRLIREREPEDPGVFLAQRLADVTNRTYDTLTLGEDAVRARGAVDSHVVYDTVRSPKFGALPGWEAALADAKKKYRHIREEAWAGVARSSAAEFPNGGVLDAGILLSLADSWERMQAARPQTEAEVQAEIDADEPLESVEEHIAEMKKGEKK
jgi:transcriptional regulator with XRE-family HTH domain